MPSSFQKQSHCGRTTRPVSILLQLICHGMTHCRISQSHIWSGTSPIAGHVVSYSAMKISIKILIRHFNCFTLRRRKATRWPCVI